MTKMLGVIAVAMLFLASFAFPQAQTQTPPGAPARPPTGLIVGQLVDGSSGSPVSSAMISLSAPAPPRPTGPSGAPAAGSPGPVSNQRLAVMTDGNGRFMFHSLAGGSYVLSASRPGYLPAQFGEAAPSSAGRSGIGRRIELTEGQRLTNVTMKIWKYASVSGRLVDEAGEPAVGATLVMLRTTGPPTARRYSSVGNNAQTDDRGVYRFSELSPGDYIIMMPSNVVSAPTAVVDAYLDGNSMGPSGNPISTAVQASGGYVPQTGRRIGDQLVGAFQGEGMPQLLISETGKMSVYPVTFYPGVRPIALATVVTLGSGEERRGVDFAARPVPAVNVSGRVMGLDGAAANMTVKLIPVGMEALFVSPSSGNEVATTVTRADGTFTAIGLPTGDYIATVTKTPVAPRGPSQPDAVISVGGGTSSFSSGSGQIPTALPTEPVLWGRTAVSVGETNIDGVAIQLAHGATVSGRVEFEAGTAPVPTADQLQRARVNLSSADGPSVIRMTTPSVAADGSFKTQGYPPGRYNLSISLQAPGWVLKSVTVGGRNVLYTPLDLAGPDVTGVVVTYTDKASELSGSIAGASADSDVGVMLFPIDYQAWIRAGMNPAGLRGYPASPDGTYQVPAIIAGDYLVVAVPAAAIQQGMQNPQMMATIAGQGTRITIGEREKRTLSLTVVKVRRP